MFKRYMYFLGGEGGGIPHFKSFSFSPYQLLSTFFLIISGGEKEGYRGGEPVSGNPPSGGAQDQNQ